MAMSSCPSGHVQVWMNAISIYMPLDQEGKIQQSTLCSQFPTATGLKYKSVDGHWMAVPSDGSGGFIVPHSTKKLFITSKPEGKNYDEKFYSYKCECIFNSKFLGHMKLYMFVCVSV